MKRRFIIPAALAAALLTACTTGGPKQSVGTVGGAVAGGVIGSQFGGGTGQLIATGVGTMLGAFVGSEIGSSLDRADQLYAQQTAQRAFETVPSGQTATWQNPDTGHRGEVTPTRTFQQAGGTPCRDFSQTIYVDGRAETATGTACRNADGTWRLVS